MTGPHDPFELHGPTDDTDDPLAERLRAALHREADMVQPSDDGLDRISTRIEQDERQEQEEGRRGWVAWVVGVAAAVVIGTIAGVLVLGDGDEPDPVATAPTPSVSPSTTPPASPTTPPASPTTTPPPSSTSAPDAPDLEGVPVYWVGDTKADMWLFREFQTVPDAGGEVASAVSAVMSGAPLDPDHRTLWSPPDRLEVTQDGDAITVDVSADAFENTQVGSQAALLAVQQVVWSATAAAGTPGPVTITVDGAAYDAWGTVALGEPMTREAGVQAQIWIDSPNEGAQVAPGVVTVSGVSTTFEATVSWELTTGDGEVVESGFTMGGANGTFDTFELTTPDLGAGTYTISVWAEDASGGESPEGPRMFEQDRTFTVG